MARMQRRSSEAMRLAWIAPLAMAVSACAALVDLGDEPELGQLDAGRDSSIDSSFHSDANAEADVTLDTGSGVTPDTGAADVDDGGDVADADDGGDVADADDGGNVADAADGGECFTDAAVAGNGDGAPTLAFYDHCTKRPVGDTVMHCCPTNSVMVGVHVIDDLYKCAWLKPEASGGPVILDQSTQCNGLHCCPASTLMVGLDNDKNYLACQVIPGLDGAETVDGNPPTEDGYPMHVCPGWASDGPSPFAMAGLQNLENLLDCHVSPLAGIPAASTSDGAIWPQ